MANYSAADVKKLRELTGAGFMDCKKALEENDGDFDKAIEFLRIKNAKNASKRAERTTAEGMVAATVPRVGRARSVRPANAAARSANSHGRPRQPRPTTTPAQPVARINSTASVAAHTSPLPSTGISTAATSVAMASQSAVPE